jgi:hypothetical protein
MKTRLFLKENWYKLTLSASAIIFSIGFFINSLQPALAAPKESNVKSPQGQYIAVVAGGGYAYTVRYDQSGSIDGVIDKEKLP